jgi:O-acetyl-ADP-ribose deacetylase (regulator of RNase III)
MLCHKKNQRVTSLAPSTDLKLDKGAVSATLLKKGGPILQQECSQKYPKGVRYGEVAVTSGGLLQCQIVYALS